MPAATTEAPVLSSGVKSLTESIREWIWSRPDHTAPTTIAECLQSTAYISGCGLPVVNNHWSFEPDPARAIQ